MHFDTFIIGHISKDIIKYYQGDTHEEIGGAVVAAAYAAEGSERKVGILTKTSEADKSLLDTTFSVPRDQIYYVPSIETTSIENYYHTLDRETRLLSAVGIADQYTMADIPDGIKAEVYHLAGLIEGDYDPELVVELSKRGKVAVDISGFMRRCFEDKSLKRVDWVDKEKYLPYITYFKVDAAEALVLTGEEDRYKAAEKIMEWGPKEVMITHNSEVLIHDGNEFYTSPYKARNLSGRTGRGDTTFSAYITERIDHDPQEAVLYASALVSIKMESPGPFKGSRKDVENYINEFYSSK
ncbi:PfkB family carbohydrate kinase [Vallitalea okinawensis]|uniref:PfkB family carbohydrate kinase n=1 Tax=Vallitalea okinawensis TaxID=2078660 RepID=UPI001A9A6D28|nr:PfkB family carbohydrate kinase [Vallitalea okinawensis]